MDSFYTPILNKDMTVLIENKDQMLLIHFQQSLSADSLPELRNKIFPRLDPAEQFGLILNFQAVDSIDAAGIAFLVQLHQQFNAHHKKVVLTGLSPKNREVIAFAQLDRFLSIVKNHEEALQVFRFNI